MSHAHMMSNHAFGRHVFASSCDRRSGSGSNLAILRVFLSTSKHFSRSAESKLVRLFTHPTRLTLASSDDMHFPCLARCCRVALARRGVQNGCFTCFSYPISKYFSRSTASRYAYLFLPHVPHIDDVTPCVALPSHHFGVDQELPAWAEIVVLRVFQIKQKPISGFSAPRYVSLLPRHVSHAHHLTTCIYLAWPGAAKLQALRHWAKIVVFEFSSHVAYGTKISYFFRYN